MKKTKLRNVHKNIRLFTFQIYDTYSRTVGLDSPFGEVIGQIVVLNEWQTVCILIPKPYRHWVHVLESTRKNLRGLNVTSLDTFTFNEDIVEMESRYEIFSLIKKDCRGE